MLKKHSVLFLLFAQLLTFGSVPNPDQKKKFSITAEQRQILEKLLSYNGQKTFILSFPGSANTWIRYCLEYLAKRPSFARFGPTKHPTGLPLALMGGFDVDLDSPPFEKVHSPYDIGVAKGKRDQDILIFILRNPKEVFARNLKPEILAQYIHNGYTKPALRVYFDDLIEFDKWDDHKKILIYYEDLITFPEQILAQLLQFLNEPLDPLVEFMANYQMHKQKGLEIKKTLSQNYTNGQETVFHSKKLTKEECKKIDFLIADRYPELWEKYLKVPYAEQEG